MRLHSVCSLGLTPCRVRGYVVEAVQIRGVNRNEFGKAEAIRVGGTYLIDLGN